MKRLFKILTVLLTLIIVMSLFAGCGDKDTPDGETTTETTDGTEETQTTETEETTEARKPLISDEVITISWMGRDDEQETLNLKGKFFDDVETITGVRIDTIAVMPNVLDDKLNLALASGDIPDIMQGNKIDWFLKYGQEGAFVPLQDLIEEHAPSIKDLMGRNEYEHARYWSRALDGNQYVIPTFTDLVGMGAQFMIREDWLTDLGIEAPNNADEILDTLRIFQEKDPAGNGDTIPFGVVELNMAQVFYMWDIEYGFFIENNEVKLGAYDPRFKEAVQWLKTVYDEKLVRPDFLSLSEDQFYEDVYSAKVGISYMYTGRLRKTEEIFAERFPNEGYKFVLLDPPESVTGERRANTENSIRKPIAISSKSDYKIEALKLLDFFCTEEGSLLSNNGFHESEEFGTNLHVIDHDAFTMQLKPGLDPLDPEVQEMTRKEQTEYGKFVYMAPYNSAKYKSIGGPYSEYDAANERLSLFFKPNSSFETSTVGTQFIYTKFSTQELRQVGASRAAIFSAMDEYLAKFVYGRLSMDDWDDYISTLEALKVNEVLDIYNTAFKRYKGEIE